VLASDQTLTGLLLHERPDDSIACYAGDTPLLWSTWAPRLKRLGAWLSTHPAQRWLLACPATDEFALWLLALLSTGKCVVLPANYQDGSRSTLTGEFDAVTSDVLPDLVPACNDSGWMPSAERVARASIDLFTSGSSGEPKRVHKSLAQLEREVATLEALWGRELGKACVIGTVPHHHIYGLLFRVLWPLVAGRPFDSTLCERPDILQARLAALGDCVLVASPAQLSRLPQLIDLAHLKPWPRCIFSSGGALPMETARALETHAGGAPVEVYGSTETGGIGWRCQNQGDHWTAFPGIRFEHDGPHTLLHSPFLPDHNTPHALDDALEFQSDGRFRLLGRLDRVVKIEDKRLSLPEMEERLATHPWIAQVAAVALSGARESVGIVATLTPAGQQALAEHGRRQVSQTLREHLSVHFDRVLLPRYWRFPEALPWNPQGKLTRAALLELFA